MHPEQKPSPIVFIVPALLVAVLFFYLRESAPAPKGHVSPYLAGFLEAAEVELLSINPIPERIAPEKLRTPYGTLDGYPILGRVRISDPAELATVRKAVRDIDRAGKSWDGAIVSCFSPRHCLRLNTRAGTRDMLICYQCSEVNINEGEKQLDRFFIHTDGEQIAVPEQLNSLLRKHGIPLAQ
jgi:hypothetical protein